MNTYVVESDDNNNEKIFTCRPADATNRNEKLNDCGV